MSAGCAICGKCCEVIGINASVSDLQSSIALEHDNPDGHPRIYNDAWLLEHWHPVSRDEAFAINPTLISAFEANDANNSNFYTCDQYDSNLKICNAGDSRPAVCSRFPWSGREPNEMNLLGWLDCSYWADVPPELHPKGVNPLPPRTFIPLGMAS